MKRKNEYLRCPAEIKADNSKNYGVMEKEQYKVNPIFLKGHYPVNKKEML